MKAFELFKNVQAAKTAVRARRVDPSKSFDAAKKLNSKAKEIKDVADGIYKNAKANKKAAQKLAKNLKKHSSGNSGRNQKSKKNLDKSKFFRRVVVDIYLKM